MAYLSEETTSNEEVVGISCEIMSKSSGAMYYVVLTLCSILRRYEASCWCPEI